ncbi:hypothetical protein [Vibrio metschnikovii]|uniref:hypothetical protein n=1 Tax=Vibrio metschnikovii TaxID=28172 RepID=UPI00130269C1|nr:hypothetical protein [Vibrio metschnikovii]
MTDIQKAVEGVMALRPGPSLANQRSNRDTRKAEALKRISDLEFQNEMKAIMEGDQSSKSLFFFSNTDASKGGRKNASFNMYAGKKE